MEDILVNILTFAAGWVLKQPRTMAKSIINTLSRKKK